MISIYQSIGFDGNLVWTVACGAGWASFRAKHEAEAFAEQLRIAKRKEAAGTL